VLLDCFQNISTHSLQPSHDGGGRDLLSATPVYKSRAGHLSHSAGGAIDDSWHLLQGSERGGVLVVVHLWNSFHFLLWNLFGHCVERVCLVLWEGRSAVFCTIVRRYKKMVM